MAFDQSTTRFGHRPGIFRQDIPVLSKNGGRPARRPPGLRAIVWIVVVAEKTDKTGVRVDFFQVFGGLKQRG